MRPEIKLPTYEVEAGSDGTGFKSGHAGEYRTYVYGNLRRKYVNYNCRYKVKEADCC